MTDLKSLPQPPVTTVSSSPIDPYPTLHHVSRMIFLLNSANLRFLHHRWQSPNIICLWLLISLIGLPLKTVPEFLPIYPDVHPASNSLPNCHYACSDPLRGVQFV